MNTHPVKIEDHKGREHVIQVPNESMELRLGRLNATCDQLNAAFLKAQAEADDLQARLEGAAADMAEMRKRITELAKDKDRMDWLEKNPGNLPHCTWVNHNLGRLFTFRHGILLGECSKTLRDAVDDAVTHERGF